MKLTCLRISNGGLKGDALPERLKLLAWGANPNTNGAPVKVTARTLSSLPPMQARKGFDRIALDYEHNTVPDSPEFKRTAEPRKVAAYGVPEVVEGEGLFVRDLVYTPSGIENAREFADLSPAVNLDESTGEVLFLHSAALCRQGAVDGLSFYSAELPDQRKGDEHMDNEALKAELTKRDERIVALSAAQDAQRADSEAKVTALTTRIDGLSAELLALRKQGIVEQAAREGKVVALSAEALAKLSIEDLTAHVALLSATAPIEARTRRMAPPPDPESVTAKFSAIKDAEERGRFFDANRDAILAGK